MEEEEQLQQALACDACDLSKKLAVTPMERSSSSLYFPSSQPILRDTYIHTYTHRCVRAYKRALMHTYMHRCVRAYKRVLMHTYMHT